jgi:uncharacterized low-complexity protein
MAKSMKPLAAALGAAFLATSIAPIVSAEVNPFSAQQLSGGYDLASYAHHGDKAEGEGSCGDKGAEGSCGDEKAEGEGKCGEGKAEGEGEGEGEAEAEAEAKAEGEGKCGEGKCGK